MPRTKMQPSPGENPPIPDVVKKPRSISPLHPWRLHGESVDLHLPPAREERQEFRQAEFFPRRARILGLVPDSMNTVTYWRTRKKIVARVIRPGPQTPIDDTAACSRVGSQEYITVFLKRYT